MSSILSWILAAITALMSLFVPFNATKAPKDKSDFVPTVRFLVSSDTHVTAIAGQRTQRMQKAMSLAYSDAEQDENYKTLDAIMWAGDLSDHGYKHEFMGFMGTINSMIHDETQLMAVVAKGHDGNNMDKDSLDFFKSLSGEPTDFHYEVNGFHFIGLSRCTTPKTQYDEYQRVWLKEQLEEAAQADPNKPIFVMHHEHVKDTVYGSTAEDGWGMDFFTDILEQYPQIVDFSGHSHYPLNDPRSIWQGAFTAVGTGALKYAEFTVDGVNKIHPTGYKKIAQSWIVEVDKDNNVRLRGFDDFTGTMLCEYVVNNPADVANRQYTPEQQKAKSSAPVFAKGAEAKAVKLFGNAKITVPAAESTDGNPVFIYRFIVLDEAGNEVERTWVLNNYWLADTYKTISDTLSVKSGSTVQIIAENAYGMQSEPLTVTI